AQAPHPRPHRERVRHHPDPRLPSPTRRVDLLRRARPRVRPDVLRQHRQGVPAAPPPPRPHRLRAGPAVPVPVDAPPRAEPEPDRPLDADARIPGLVLLARPGTVASLLADARDAQAPGSHASLDVGALGHRQRRLRRRQARGRVRHPGRCPADDVRPHHPRHQPRSRVPGITRHESSPYPMSTRASEYLVVTVFVTVMAAANLSIAAIGPWFLPVTAFFAVGVVLVSRDYL